MNMLLHGGDVAALKECVHYQANTVVKKKSPAREA